MKTQTFEKMANLYYPQGCQCHDDSGSCDWCRVYYGEDKPWIDEEGRELPLPKRAEPTITNHSGMTAMDVVGELTYQNYAHNRRISPHISVERWTKAYGPNTPEMEARFLAENPNQPTPEQWQRLEYQHINRYAE